MAEIWEYSVDETRNGDLQEFLNDMGLVGWELVFAVRQDDRERTWHLIFKRRKPT